MNRHLQRILSNTQDTTRSAVVIFAIACTFAMVLAGCGTTSSSSNSAVTISAPTGTPVAIALPTTGAGALAATTTSAVQVIPTAASRAATRTASAPATVAVSSSAATVKPTTVAQQQLAFDGDHAFNAYLVAQMNMGPRIAGTPADRAAGDWIAGQLTASHWAVVTQESIFRNLPFRNIVGKAGQGRGPLIVLGAHYDTRKYADQDKTNPKSPVPGGNDGASGVAVLLELARTLDVSRLKNEVWLVFFDAEDNGEIPGCQVTAPPCTNDPFPWSVGATYTADHLPSKPEAVVVVDMIGDKDQNIYYEQNSDKGLQQTLWGIAANLGYSSFFIPEFKWSMDDDHTPFLKNGIRAIDIIDFDYPYWHTTADTADKCSPQSLEHVGRVLQNWLENK